jgi:hypothetical protein
MANIAFVEGRVLEVLMVVKGIIDGHVGAARDSKHDLDSFSHQRFNSGLRAGHFQV